MCVCVCVCVSVFIHYFITYSYTRARARVGYMGRGQRSRYRDSLRVGRSGNRISMGAKFPEFVQVGLGAHPNSYTMDTGSLSGAARAWR